MSFPALSSVSVCVRVQWDPEWNEVSTIFSYAAPVFTNEFQLRGQADMQERILLALIIHGKHLPYKASFPNDGAWHHICVTWRRSIGQWAIYVDGIRKDMGSGTGTSRDIHGDGILILGQDQDSFGGNFTEPFFGAITDLNVWNMYLETRQASALNACSLMTQEVLFSWNLDYLTSHPVVKEVQALLFCPGKISMLLCIPSHSSATGFLKSAFQFHVIRLHQLNLINTVFLCLLFEDKHCVSVMLETDHSEEVNPLSLFQMGRKSRVNLKVTVFEHHCFRL